MVLNFLNFDIPITNYLVINIVCFSIFISFNFFTSSLDKESNRAFLLFKPSTWQKYVEILCEIASKLIYDIINTDNEKYFPIISVLFMFILFCNLVGLIPYTFTITSHLFITFMLSFSLFIGINIITFKKYKLRSFSLFIPSNTTFFLALLLIPIELVSYIAKPISLGVRLFINLMAGHTLLKVILGFSWSLLILDNLMSIGLISPLISLVVLFGLELGVALIQTYVFIVLTCMYVQDAC